MAKMIISAELDNFINELERFANDEPDIAKEVVNAGAQPVADRIRETLYKLQEEPFHRLSESEEFSAVPLRQKNDLLNSMGITPADVDKEGNTNVKIGFDGYGKLKTKKYPNGVPNALLARAIESGSSVRKKTPFVRPAVNKSRNAAIAEMDKVLNEKVKIYAL